MYDYRCPHDGKKLAELARPPLALGHYDYPCEWGRWVRGQLILEEGSDCILAVDSCPCGVAGEAIDMYAGLKHSSCSQYVNEKGLSIDELQMLTDHARRDSVMQYASVQLEAKRRILERKVIPLGEIRGKDSAK